MAAIQAQGQTSAGTALERSASAGKSLAELGEGWLRFVTR